MLTTAAPWETTGLVPRSDTAKVRLENVWKWFTKPDGETYAALGGVNIEVPEGSFTAIVGPSGCGKSTLLRLVAGLSQPSHGQVTVDGRQVTGVDARVGFLFQDDALLPWRSVLDNVALGLRFRGVHRGEIRERVASWLARVGLRGFDGHYPAQLSGGMRKRVALAQTLIYDPEIILMDEPFAHLDAQTRHLMEMDLLSLCGDGNRTILFVTHDLEEAVSLADTVVVMTAGPASRVRIIEQVDLARPRDLLSISSEPRFGELTRALWRHLYEEVTRVYGR